MKWLRRLRNWWDWRKLDPKTRALFEAMSIDPRSLRRSGRL